MATRSALQRRLLVIADDYGIGPETSRGILNLAERGQISATVLVVNSPYAEESVRLWRRADLMAGFGWHPNLTLDAPLVPASKVPSLVGPDGRFWPLGQFLARWALGRLKATEIATELRAQLNRFIDLVGSPPDVVNTHQHVGIFEPVTTCLHELLAELQPRPFVRRVREPWSMLNKVPGSRLKRCFLNRYGRRQGQALDHAKFPGADWLAGITDHAGVHASDFFARWLRHIPGETVELMVHPGHHDDTLVGRDCKLGDGCLERHTREQSLLSHPNFSLAYRDAGFAMATPQALAAQAFRGYAHAG